MAVLYGTLQSERGESTRTAQRMITATAQSWRGSISITLSGQNSGGDVRIAISQVLEANPAYVLFVGLLADLLQAAGAGKHLIISE